MKHTVTSIVCFCLAILAASMGRPDLYVDPDGDDSSPGTKAKPLASLEGARNAMRALKKDLGSPKAGVTVWIREGVYGFDSTLKFSSEDSGTHDAPITYHAWPGERVVFDATIPIPSGGFGLVESREDLARLCDAAKGEVMAASIEDPEIREALSRSGSQISYNGRMAMRSRFPNVGFAHVDTIIEKGSVYAEGRTQGDPPQYDMANPIGGVFTIVEKPTGDWEAEVGRLKKARITGYLAYDWYRQDHRMAGIYNGQIHLLEYSRYGIQNNEKIPRRVVARDLLCEIDQPGEWFYDDEDCVLYLWPYDRLDDDDRIGVWAGPPFAVFDGSSHVTLRDLTIQGTTWGDGMVVFKGGAHNRLVGCTLRNTSRVAVVIEGGTDNGLTGCDIYDAAGHVNLSGGETRTLTPGRNYVVNCHFTQVEATDFYGRIAVRGVGQIFRNNLVHNHIGQVMTVGGNDHTIELNELFNIGMEEGDGGAIYSGAEMWSYGNVYRHNFLHHLMCIPEAHPRGGIYPDDLNAGNTIVGNVFYKAAHRAILVNGGAANTVAENVMINGYIGIYNTSAWAERIRTDIEKFEAGELKRGDKNDHIWRVEQVVGKDGWNRPPWSTKYPLFQRVMNQEKMRFYPIECRFIDNVFCGNAHAFQFRTGWGQNDFVDIYEVDYIETSGNREIEMSSFVDPKRLDFTFCDPDAKPSIPFGKIGLIVDEFRSSVPDKTSYRSAVRDHFADRASFDPKAEYDSSSINVSLYLNTGRLLVNIQ